PRRAKSTTLTSASACINAGELVGSSQPGFLTRWWALRWGAKAHAWPSGPSVLHRGEAGFGPAAPAAIHGENVGVAHLLQIVRHQRGAESAPAVKHDGSRLARQGILNVAL